MSTLASAHRIEQGAIANFPKTFSDIDIFASAELFAAELQEATTVFLKACQSAYILKAEFDKFVDDPKERKILAQQRQQIKEQYGWSNNLVASFAKIADSIVEIEDSHLNLLDINTIKAVASPKYDSVRERMECDRLTVLEVREEMAIINKSLKKPKKTPEVLEWQTDKDGIARLVIRLEDEEAGKELERQYHESKEACFAFFIRELLQRPQIQQQIDSLYCEEARQDADTYIESLKTDEILELGQKIEECDRGLAQYPNPTLGTEMMMVGVIKSEKLQYQEQLKQLTRTILSFQQGGFDEKSPF